MSVGLLIYAVGRVYLQFVAHPNCQQHLTSVWYGPEMGFMQSLALGKKMIMYDSPGAATSNKMIMWLLGIPLVPIFCFIYIVSPKSKVFTDYKYTQLVHVAGSPCAVFFSAYSQDTTLLNNQLRPLALSNPNPKSQHYPTNRN